MAESPSRKLQVLCLHGSRQDGEVFSQRIDTLRRRLQPIAELHFVDAPHELPLEPGQEVHMRAWWRHPGLDVAASTSQPDCNQHETTQQSAHCHPLYDNRMVSDWQASLTRLRQIWETQQGFDAVLGFSNGAAAAFLLASHIVGESDAWPGRKLKCVILASGYVPEPLEQLVPASLTMCKQLPLEATSTNAEQEPSSALQQPLKVASLHMYSARDQAVTKEQSAHLVQQFDASRRQVLEHDLAHCVPQKAQHCQTILDFLSWFEPDTSPQHTATPLPPQPTATVTAPQTTAAEAVPPDVVGGGTHAVLYPPPGDIAAQEGAETAAIACPEQQEEVQALQAIYDTAFTLLSSSPASFVISLRDPSQEPPADDNPDSSGQLSAAFSLVFTLPEHYPSSGQPPTLTLHGPMLKTHPLYASLIDHLTSLAQQELSVTGSGCCYQLVDAAREWLDTQLPPNFLNPQASNNSQDNTQGDQTPWWEDDVANSADIQEATSAAAKAHWSHFYGNKSVTSRGGDMHEDSSQWKDVTGEAGSEMSEMGSGGRWDFTIGLVGKPSAGKSSLFNALTCALADGQGAKVSAQPFTTIAPNIGRGFALVPDPARACGLHPSDCKPTHGYVSSFDPTSVSPTHANVKPLTRWMAHISWGQCACWRRVPVLIKDVAGLVPGAYAGRGRGNAFLNDLCDADVLIHVVDVSGSTDTEGRPAAAGEGADPLHDIGWVREEIHRWVYDNVRRKWGIVRRRPTRLVDMFTGYHVPRAMVYEILERVGLPASVLSSDKAAPLLTSWGEKELHYLVATFLHTRFPILLALNKADLPSSAANIQRVTTTFPLEPAVPVSAASERWLAAAAHAGTILHQAGQSCVEVCQGSATDADTVKRVQEIKRRVLETYGSTGVLLAVTTALALRPPKVVFPVADCQSCTALPCKGVASGTGVLLGAEDAKARAAEGTSPSILRDVVLLKPNSTCADLFMVLKKPPWQLLEGEYVRSECRVLQCLPDGSNSTEHMTLQKQVLKKDDVLSWAHCVIRIMVNRKNSGWQK